MGTTNKRLYMIIRDDLKSKIDSGFYSEGDLIPTEAELQKGFSVSRVTVRRALEDLEKENYITRTPGLGTVVNISNDKQKMFTNINSATNELEEMGVVIKTLEASVDLIEADYWLSTIFHIPLGEPIYRFTRVRGTETPILFSNTYIRNVIKIPNTEEFLLGSLYSFLTSNNITFNHLEENVTAVKVSDEILKILQVTKDDPILKRTRLSYDVNNNLMEYSETYYNGLRYEYRTKIQNRK